MNRLLLKAVSLVVCSSCAPALVAEVMREGEVSEQALIEALKPPASLGQTRSIRLQRVEETDKRAAPPSSPAAVAASP